MSRMGGGASGAGLTFKTIAVSGQSDIVADAAGDTVNVAAGDNVTLTTDEGINTLTITAASGGGAVDEDQNVLAVQVFT